MGGKRDSEVICLLKMVTLGGGRQSVRAVEELTIDQARILGRLAGRLPRKEMLISFIT